MKDLYYPKFRRVPSWVYKFYLQPKKVVTVPIYRLLIRTSLVSACSCGQPAL